ncbi:DsbA family protein [Gemmatimonadota bacterium]
MSKGNAGGDLRRFYIIFAAVALVGIGAVGYSVGSQAMGNPVMEPVDLEGIDDLRRLTELAVPVTSGAEDAPVTIIVFGDYLCNHCSAFSLRERPLVEENYVDTGVARLIFYDFPLDPRPEVGTFLAARAARCAGDQGRYWEYHDQLYRSQLTWGLEADKIDIFQDYAEALGLDRGDFRGCLNSDRHAEAVTANRELAHALGLTGTPAVLVGTGSGMSRRLPSYYFEAIQEAVESVLAGG